MGSPYSAQTLPVPGPSTIRLSLIKTSIELYGMEQTENIVFPFVKDASIKIRPPREIGITSHMLKMLKPAKKQAMRETIGYREFAHTKDIMTIYFQIQNNTRNMFAELFDSIGYWGQASSFATCIRIYEEEPSQKEIIQPLINFQAIGFEMKQVFTSFVSEWMYEKVFWKEIIGIQPSPFIKTKVYIYPLAFCERQSTDSRLLYCSLE